MKVHYGVDVVNDSPVLRPAVAHLPGEMPAVERLPFTVSVARSDEQLRKAVSMRHAAYARHVPALAEKLKAPEPCDHEEGSVVLLAESKLDGSPLGTMRIQTNRYRPLAIEQSVELPQWLQDCSLAEATRLGVALGRVGRMVKTLLFKAFFRYCEQAEIDWMVIGGRAPLDKQYEALLFQDVFPERGFIPLRHASNIPHRVLAFEVETAEARWSGARHPLFNFVFGTRHPDLDLGHERPLLMSAKQLRPSLYGMDGTQ
ncbi:MAG TPA: hypothetical protein VLX30_13200 [Burkholderiales bacterium]|nr:hypothetical protein [Burkholderiales bacterium]